MPTTHPGRPGDGRARTSTPEITVAYFGHRFSGPLLATHFRHGLARAGVGAVRLETSPVRFALRMVRRRLRRRAGGPVLSVMVHPALGVLWPLVPRSQRFYVIHDTTPHPHRWWNLRWRLITRLDRRLAARSATVVALSAWSADDWQRDHAPEGQRVALVPHPEMVGRAAGRPMRPPELVGLHEPYVLLFGRADRYKGVRELWPHLERWRAATGHTVVVAGVGSADDVPAGAARDDPGVRVIDRYLSEAEIDWMAGGDCILLLPYTSATQSGVLERFALGPAVPLGYAVGGLAEQLASVQPDLAVTPLRPDELLRRLDVLMADPGLRAELVRAKAERTRALDRRFVASLAELLGTPGPGPGPGGDTVIDLTTPAAVDVTDASSAEPQSSPGPPSGGGLR